MPKREAESQLTKDAGSDDEIEESSGGFAKADEATMSGRKIRGLPKRAGSSTPAGSPAPAANGAAAVDTPAQASRFGGFTGFGASAPPAFSFGPSATQAAPAAETSASSKAFASFLSPASQITPPATPTGDSSSQEQLFKYYASLRGLNTAFMQACTKVAQADAFTNLEYLFTRYKDHRAIIEKEKPMQLGGSANGSANASTQAPVTKPLSMPVPPSSFSFAKTPISPFPSIANPTSTSAAAAGPSPFTLPAFGSSPFASATKTEPAKSSADTASSSTGLSSQVKLPPMPAFGITSSSPIFGKPSDPKTELSATGGSNKADIKSTFPAFGGSTLFSSKPAVAAVIAPSAATTSTTPTPFSFGFGAGKPVTQPFSFGSGKGSIGNPVGFSFGASPPKTADATATPTPPAASPAADAATPPAAQSPAPGAASEAGDASRAETPATEADAASVIKTTEFDVEGPGEEDEETTYVERAKCYKLLSHEGKMEWVDMGIGMVRCKKHKVTDARRLLMRGSTSGNIIINFSIFSSLKVTVQKNTIVFVGMDNGNPTNWRLKVKTEAAAQALHDAIDKEVKHVAESKG